MKVEIKIPKMGESIVEMTIGSILKKTGSSIRADEEILELETEKVNQVLFAPASGKLELNVQEGDLVKIDQVIGVIDTEAIFEADSDPASEKEPPKEDVVEKDSIEVEQKELPKARKSIDDSLNGSLSPQKLVPPLDSLKDLSKTRANSKETRKKMTKLRKVIASKLVQAKNEAAMLTTFNEVDLSAIIEIRTQYKEAFEKKHKVRLGFMSFFIKACVSALQEIPDINARIHRDEIVYHHFYDIGVAVGSDKGLFVPVIRNADQLSYAEIEKDLKRFAEKARNQTISIDEIQGGTFTISNGGVYGSMLSTPILNPPQSGILGMHKIQNRAVVVDDRIVILPMMYLALSYDHRIVDGKQSITFLMHVKKKLENPERFLIDL